MQSKVNMKTRDSELKIYVDILVEKQQLSK